ncbi:MAG: hypothetical protein A2827_03385 [Candidatus Spechtbacteria bacterium RIFCSPHIGHO2_01_FULL_43_30]|uniref:Type II secretion system protein GspF domain-containing protein n=1 Tax=Candidatus Spechtbacteria bacterium RIFCSPHIGHO2_01_FULL_43_30 TaxID=1802158 RepID=A0A1G2H8J7_9BACT|nr:MAG: hypothetical protein A2827_03385 [Candidatus Spechtbacteria bacterium RIFCSPHIGHO2_01_FULL_43_30]
MSVFNYQARTKEGEIQEGRVEATSKESAAEILQRHGLIVTLIERSQDVPIYSRNIKIFQGVKKKEIVIFCRQLTTLFASEIPLVMALRTIARQTRNPVFREKVSEIAADVEGGLPFSDALSKHKKIFSEFYVQMVKAGEVSGKLDEILVYLADNIEREYQVASKIKGAMIYPAFITFAFGTVVLMIMIFVIPQLQDIFEESGQDLPFLTRVIVGASDFLRTRWYVLIVLLPVIGFFVWKYRQTEAGRQILDRIKLKIPVFGGILKKVYLFRFSESLGTLIKGGIPIIKSLTIAGDVTGNEVFRRIVHGARDSIKRGASLGEGLVIYDEIPPLVSQMVAVGEQAGKLDMVLDTISDFYEKEVNVAIDSLTSLIEPLMLVIMGLGVGLLVAGVMLPIYNMAGTF